MLCALRDLRPIQKETMVENFMNHLEIQIWERIDEDGRRDSTEVFSQKISMEKVDPTMIPKIVAVINNLPFPITWNGVGVAVPQPK